MEPSPQIAARLRIQLRLWGRMDRDRGRVQRWHVAHCEVQPPGGQGKVVRGRLSDGGEAAVWGYQEHRGGARVLPWRNSHSHAGCGRRPEEPGMKFNKTLFQNWFTFQRVH